MLKPIAFANSLAAVILVFRVIAIIAALILPKFDFSLRSASLGLMSSNSRAFSLTEMILSAIIPAVAAWILSYCWALLYNKWLDDSMESSHDSFIPSKRKK
jgi:hypothetical protein